MFPYTDLESWAEATGEDGRTDAHRQREASAAALLLRYRRDDVLRQAVFVGSESLANALDTYDDLAPNKRERAERALVRYFSRACGRSTPYGLFAGVSLGTFAAGTDLRVGRREDARVLFEVDVPVIRTIVRRIEDVAAVRRSLRYQLNTTLYHAGDRYRYLMGAEAGENELVGIESSAEFETVLASARNHACFGDIVGSLEATGIPRDAAVGYVDEIIRAEILVSELAPALTGQSPIRRLAEQLSVLEGSSQFAKLAEIPALLEHGIGDGVETLVSKVRAAHNIVASYAPLPEEGVLHGELLREPVRATLGSAVTSEVRRAVETLTRISSRVPDPFIPFVRRFEDRYGDAFVPLPTVLDPDVGMGWEPPDPRAFAKIEQEDFARSAPTLHGLVDRAVRHRLREIELDERILASLEGRRGADPPSSSAANVSLWARSGSALARGDFRVVIGSVVGPSGARQLGRHGLAHPAIAQLLTDHLREEEDLSPTSTFAEVVFAHDGRAANVSLRPSYRPYEIPYLGTSGLPPGAQIPISELLVGVRAQQVVLWSERLNRRVLPRMSSAHNYHFIGPPIYRFLCGLQDQSTAWSLAWSWSSLEGSPFLPRIRTGRAILAKARWSVDGATLRNALGRGPDALYAWCASWRAAMDVPRWVTYNDASGPIPVDLGNALMVESIVSLAARQPSAIFTEFAPDDNLLMVTGEDGRYAHEMLIPLSRSASVAAPVIPHPVRVIRRCTPGSGWTFVNAYAAPTAIDRILLDVLPRSLAELAAGGALRGWFFVRYSEPEWHLRWRIHANSPEQSTFVIAKVRAALDPLVDNGTVWRWQLDTYVPELARYGGPEGIAAAESVFHGDSSAVVAALSSVQTSDDERLLATVVGADALLADLGLGVRERLDLVGLHGRPFDRTSRLDAQRVGREVYGRARAQLQTQLGRSPDEPSSWAYWDVRSRAIRPFISTLVALRERHLLTTSWDALAGSFLHMHVNRMARQDHAVVELVVRDVLRRAYDEALRRNGRVL